MIEINLLPDNLKPKKEAVKIDTLKLLYLVPAFAIILLISHLYLLGFQISRAAQLTHLEKKMKQLEPQKKDVEAFHKEYAQVSGSAKALHDLTARRVNWADKLAKLSVHLPAGIWFTDMAVSGKDFSLKAAVISLEKQEMSLINRFMDSLRKDADFFKDFLKIELDSVQRKVIGGYDVAEFVLAGSLK